MTRIILCGAAGKMGRVIASCCNENAEYKIVAGVDVRNEQYADFPVYTSITEVTEEADAIIDFSHPSALSSVLKYAVCRNLPAVIATTGLSPEQTAQVKETGKDIPVFFTANMSLGVNLMVALSRKATQVLKNNFDIEIIEKHHNQKIDAPSGTALMLADAINEELDNSAQYMFDRHSRRIKRTKNEIGIHSVRGGTIVGEHEVIFAGRDETLSIVHSATSKEVFAVGALKAAEFIKDKEPSLYDMADMLSL